MSKSKVLSGSFPGVTEADEERLRAAHFVPVLRWVRHGPRPREKAVMTAEAYAIIEREERKKAVLTTARRRCT